MELENSRKRNTTSNIIKLFFCMCFVFVAFLFKNNINAATYGIMKYKEINNGTEIEITGCDRESKETLNIPSTIDGKPVTSIGESAFNGCYNLTGKLVIPDSVTQIGDYAFYSCNNLTGDLVIPDNVTTIGKCAFSGCRSLTGRLVIPKGVTSIERYAFSDCSGLTGDLVIPDNVTTIGEGAFFNCRSLTGNLVIPDSVTQIGDKAFYLCSNFTGDLVISDNVTSIGEQAFYKCIGFDGKLTLSNSVTSIGYEAFYNCSNLTGDLIIPESVTSIGNSAFALCEKIKKVIFYSDSPELGEICFNPIGGPIYYRKGTSGFTEDNNYDVSRLIPYELKLKNTSVKLINSSNSESMKLAYDYDFIKDLINGITYTSDDKNVVTVNSEGKIIAQNNGKTKVNAVVSMGTKTKVTLSEDVQVAFAVTSINLDKEKLEFTFTNTQKINATILPSNAANKTLKWTSSNEKVAVVDQNGVVRAVANGSAIITCTTTDGSNISKSINVTVSNIPEGFSNKGDVNDDGKVDLVDVFLVYNYYLKNSGNTSINASELAKADLNGDKKIDLLDVYLTYNIYLKRTSGLPLTYQVGEGGTISDSSRTVVVGEMCKVSATPNTGYKFVGWYVNNKLISTDSTIEFTMPNSNTTIEAKLAKM